MYERTYHKAVLKTEEKQSKQRTRINWKLVLRLVIAAAIVAGCIILIRMPRLQVKTIAVTGVNVTDPGDVVDFVHQKLQGNVLFILPKTSIFLVPVHTLERDIRLQFPRLQTVSVGRKNFSGLTINVTEYQGMYLWCTTDTECYFMDAVGMAFAPAPYFSGNAYPKIFSGSLSALPFQAVNADQLQDITLILERLPMIGIDPESFHFESAHELEVDFNHYGYHAQLLFDPTEDINDALVALYTGLRTNPLATKFRQSSQILQYIDLRFSNRVVYKFQ